MTKTLVAAPDDDFERRWWLHRIDHLLRLVLGFRKSYGGTIPPYTARDSDIVPVRISPGAHTHRRLGEIWSEATGRLVEGEPPNLVEFLRARLGEDEAWALAASKPYQYADGNPEVPVGGVHWTWVVGKNWEPVVPDPVVDEHVTNDDEDWSCNLATVEQWPSGRFTMPTTYAGTIEEMDAVAARHIARHDPARVLAEVDAKRRIIAEHERIPGDGVNFTWGEQGRAEDVLRLLALPYASHPDYLEEWKP